MWNQLGSCYCCSSQTGHHQLISNPPYENRVHYNLSTRTPTPLLPPHCFFPQPTMIVQPTQLLHILHHPPHQENLHHQQEVQKFFMYETETSKQFGVEHTENMIPFENYGQSIQPYFPSIPAYQSEFVQVVTTDKVPVNKVPVSEILPSSLPLLAQKNTIDDQSNSSNDTTQNEQHAHSQIISSSNGQYVKEDNKINEPNNKEGHEKVTDSVQIDPVQNSQQNQKEEEDVLVPRKNSPPSQTIPTTNQIISLSPTPLFLEGLEISQNTLFSHQNIQTQTLPVQVPAHIFHPKVIQNNNYSDNEMIFQSCHSHSKELHKNKNYLVQNNHGHNNSRMRPFEKSQSLSNSILNKRKNLWVTTPKRVLTCGGGGSLGGNYCMSFQENLNQSSLRSDWSIISKRRHKKSSIGIKRVSFSADNLPVNREMNGRTNEQHLQQEKTPSEPLPKERQVLQNDFMSSTENYSNDKLKPSNKNQKSKSQKSSEIIQVLKHKEIQGNTNKNDKILLNKMKNKQKSTEQKKQKIVGLAKNYSSKSNKAERNKISQQQQQQQHRRMYNNNSPRQLVLPSLTSHSVSNYSTALYNNEKYKLCRKESQGLQVCGCNLTLRRPYSDQMGLLPNVNKESDIAYSSKGPGQDLTGKVLKLREHNRLPMLSPISARKHCFTARTSSNQRHKKYITATKNYYATVGSVKSIDSINYECGYSSSENSNPNPRILRRNSKTRTNFYDYRVPSFDSKPIINPMKFKRFQEKIRRLSTPPNTHNSTLKNAYYIYPECDS